MRCGYYSVEGFEGKYWIPGCWGGAMNGKSGCYCYKPIVTKKQERDSIDKQYEELESECRRLKQLLEESQKKLNKAEIKIRLLEIQGLPLAVRRKLDDPAYELTIINRLKQQR